MYLREKLRSEVIKEIKFVNNYISQIGYKPTLIDLAAYSEIKTYLKCLTTRIGMLNEAVTKTCLSNLDLDLKPDLVNDKYNISKNKILDLINNFTALLNRLDNNATYKLDTKKTLKIGYLIY